MPPGVFRIETTEEVASAALLTGTWTQPSLFGRQSHIRGNHSHPPDRGVLSAILFTVLLLPGYCFPARLFPPVQPYLVMACFLARKPPDTRQGTREAGASLESISSSDCLR